MSEQLERCAELIERLLGDPELRRRFRSEPATILVQAGLPELAAGLRPGDRALMTLELRESRSSLAGMLVAAAAEGVDFAHFAEHAAPELAHDAGHALDRLVTQPKNAAPVHDPAGVHPAAAPAEPSIGPPARIPKLEPPPAPAHPVHPSTPTASAASRSEPAAASTASPATPAGRAQLTTAPGGAAHHPETPSPATPAPEPGSGVGYPGDEATPQQLAAWMGARAQRAGLPPELPVMAALTESGLRNLSYGDRDSVGFFQMRLGIWDEGAYAGYPDHPDLQIQWFIDHALAARAQDPALAQSPTTWGDWVANVEQPASEYRYRYQLQLSAAEELLRGADLAPTAGSVAPVPVGQAALTEAMHLVGHGADAGASLRAGPDSASLVQFAYARQGIQLPPAAAEQFDVGIPVAKEHLRPGDAVFFAQAGGYIHHVGLYIGHGRFVSAAAGGGDVKVSSLSDPGFAHEYAGARRYTAAALSNPASYARPLPTIEP